MPRPTRTEHDSLGPVAVPRDALYGAQTVRALEASPRSRLPMPPRLLWALALIKRSCAEANEQLGLLDTARAEWIVAAAQEVMDGRHDDQFPLDVFQTGSGTATNMNMNEVLSNRAIEMMGGQPGSKDPVHPNDHVNLGQSSNDTIPTALHVAGAVALDEELLPALRTLRAATEERAATFGATPLTGRTHLMDATPLTAAQLFGGWADQLRAAEDRATRARDQLLPLALGGTAVGTGINRAPELASRAIALIADETRLDFVEAPNHISAQSAMDAVVGASGELRAIAVGLSKIANDIRLLASGPRTGLAELRLPALAPGSSIMPGKVNPILCESLVMIAYQVMGNDAAIALGGQAGHLQLTTTLPLLARNLLESVGLLAEGCRRFASGCMAGIELNTARIQDNLDRNLSLATALAPVIGYDRASTLAKHALQTGRTLRALALEDGMDAAELDRLLDPATMTQPG